MTRQRAEQELSNILADVRRGIWTPPQPDPVPEEPQADPTFHRFATDWLEARKAEGLSAKTVGDLEWSLSGHLLKHFADYQLGEITPRVVDGYKVAKTQERATLQAAREEAIKKGERPARAGLSNGSINHTLRHLAQILETAVEYEMIAANPATGKRRRLKAERPSRPWVEPEQLMALLDATSGVGRVLLSILAGGGLRIGEALALRWQHVDLGTGTLHVVDSKTAKGIREIHLTSALRGELTVWSALTKHAKSSDHVVSTSTGGKGNPSNLRRDVLAPAVKAANAQLAELGISPIGSATFHSLRRTYASLRCACGDDIRYTADQLGHEDPRFTLRAYAQATRRRDRLSELHREAFDRALDWARIGGLDWAPMGTNETIVGAEKVALRC